jgi:hypothetical protein
MFDFLRSFLPIENPLGFGAGDYLELLLAALLLAAMLLATMAWGKPLAARASRLAERTVWSMALLAVLPVALRLALLPHHPAPSPDVYDEFSHLLVADTLRHFRLANPMHPLHQFFETFFVLQEPTYSSIYPLGQGLVMALGWMIFGSPWAGVILATAAFCALCYWMLRGWTTPGWALAGGALAVMEFGPLSQWMNGYWGGAVAAASGCLVFGALPRLRTGSRRRDALLLGLGLAIHLLTRPYETLFLGLAAGLFFVPAWRTAGEARRLGRIAAVAALVIAPAIVLTLVQNRQVTGSWTTLPYALSQYQYGVPTSLTIQANPVPHAELTPQQQMDYRMQTSFRPSGGESWRNFLERLEYRVRYYRFYFLPPLYLALACFLPCLRQYRFAWVAMAVTLLALGANFFPAFQVHYVAAATCLFVLMSVTGLEWLSRLTIGGRPAGAEAARLVFFVCVAHFLFWYGLHVFDTGEISRAVRPYETWDGINHGNPERRIAVRHELEQVPGDVLILVHYAPQHIFQEEWVWNAADIDGARVVWARDLGPDENAKLLAYYPTRTALLFEPDARPMRLTRYRP